MGIEARNRTLVDWFTRIRTRQTVLPRFQRFAAWDHSDVARLFNTVLQGLPIGSALVLEIGNEEPFFSRTLEGAPKTGERVTEHLLDGQQRLTALWRALHNNYENRTFFLVCAKDEETKLPYYVDSIARWKKEGDTEPRPFWANKPSEQWKRHRIPLDLFRPGPDTLQAFKCWVREAVQEESERDKLEDLFVRISQQFASFNFPFLSLPVTTPKEVAVDVFIKMNTSAAPLTPYDIVVAQVEVAMGQSLHELVADIRNRCPAIADYYAPEQLVLYASALLQDRTPSNATYLASDFGPRLLKNWSMLLEAVPRTVKFLEEERVFDAARLPTDVVVPILAALWASAPDGFDAEGRARTLLRKYLWRAFCSPRYERSTNSRALADYRQLNQLLATQSATPPAVFEENLPEVEEILQAGWPKKKDRLARAVLAIALRNGGIDLADGAPVTRENIKRREYHHLFPEAHLTQMGRDERQIYLALNCALVTWRTNRRISDHSPERYLAERRDAAVLGEPELKARLASHVIPYDEMIAGDYDAFLKKRASMIHQHMTRLCEGCQS